MPEFQLPVAATLAASALCSLGAFALSGSSEGKIRLPTSAQDADGEPLKDPFDVTKPEDWVDGEPLDEEAFWSRMRLRKLALAAIFAAILALQAVSLGWAVMEEDNIKIAVQSLHIAFALYLFSITALALNKNYSPHSLTIIHICALTFLSTGLLGTLAILPSNPMPVTKAVHFLFASVSVLQVCWYGAAVLYLVATFVAFTTPRGPALHFPSDRIYSEKTLMQLSSRYEDNVCGVTGTFASSDPCLRLN